MASKNNIDWQSWALIIGGGVVLLNIMGGVKSLFESIGLKDSAETKALDTLQSEPGSWWNPNFYKTGGTGVLLLTQSAANAMADAIYNAFGMFNDNEEQAIGVFRLLKTQSQGSFLAKTFLDRYGMDLLTFLRGGHWPQDRLSDADVSRLSNFVNSLPKYKI